LAALVNQIKKELLGVAPGENTDAPMLLVELVELGIQVTLNRWAIGGKRGLSTVESFG
jgi:hypothetical protein